MNIQPTRIFPLGDSAITVEFGNELSIELNDASICLANYLSEHPFPGLIEAVPAMASVDFRVTMLPTWVWSRHSLVYRRIT